METLRRYRITDLDSPDASHVASHLIPGRRLSRGGLSFHPPGFRTHDKEGRHTHDDHEVFVIMQGRGVIEIEGRKEPVRAGDVLVIEPGEDHHLVGDPDHPIVNLWFHASDEGHPDQQR